MERLYYEQGEFENIKTFEFLNNRLQEVDKLHSTAGNYLFYLAMAPENSPPSSRNLANQVSHMKTNIIGDES